MVDPLGFSDRIIECLAQVYPIVEHLRAQAEPSMQAQQDGRISGTPEVTSAPMQLAPLDEADELWAKVCSLAEMLAEKLRLRSPSLQRLLARQWVDRVGSVPRVRGYARSDTDQIYEDTFMLTQWLIAHASTLAFNAAFKVPVEELIEDVARLKAKVAAFSGYEQKHYQAWRCPSCHEFAILPIWGDGRRVGWVCEQCEWEEVR